MVEKLIN